MSARVYDVAVIGGGIVGTATAMALTARARLALVVLEAEPGLAAHQTGHNSGVIHSGLYYKPGSLKARNCVEGREALYRFCERARHPARALRQAGGGHLRGGAARPRRTGAARPGQRAGGAARDSVRPRSGEFEPAVSGIAGLHVPETGIVDYTQVTEAFARWCGRPAARSGRGAGRAPGRAASGRPGARDARPARCACRALVNCAGLQSDRVARLCGVEPGLQIVPFRGEYYELIPERQHLVRNLIYPVPDPRFPFLGVHFTRMIDGGVEAGPNAVLAFKREGYRRTSFSAA